MLDRDRNTQGFTLAELLLAIAIVLVLAALAAPSISNIQRNMRMLELDAAASDIAVTAQQQMTSMKVSGTWLALFDGDSPQLPTGDQNALNVPSGVVDNHPEQNDLYYMTADQARTAGIIPAGSIDAAVRNGDYLIEYSLSTATGFLPNGTCGYRRDEACAGLLCIDDVGGRPYPGCAHQGRPHDRVLRRYACGSYERSGARQSEHLGR